MTLSNINKRQVLVATSAAIVIVALGFVATRMGPLAPTKRQFIGGNSSISVSDALNIDRLAILINIFLASSCPNTLSSSFFFMSKDVGIFIFFISVSLG